MGMKELGATIKESRNMRGWSLRLAEEKTGISNGYLCLMEQGEIKEPSPHMLQKIADAYQIEYLRLMELAGYIETPKSKASTHDSVGVALSSTLKELSKDQIDDVKKYIQFIRSKKIKVAH
jgi:transcriptional regulator with XRE-family HTH domain